MSKNSVDENILFKKLIESSHAGITLLDAELNIIYRSPSAEKITGWHTSKRKKNTLWDLTHPEDQQKISALLDEVRSNSNKPMTESFRALNAHGLYIWLECTFTNYLDDADINAIICNFTDITERKETEVGLVNKSAQLQSLIDSITDGFIVLDENMRYTYVNEHVVKMLGRTEKSLMGKYIWDVFPDAIGSETYNAIQTVYKEHKYICNDDYYAPLNLWQENRIYPSGNGILMFIRDITKRKNEELRLKLMESVITHASDAVLITEANPLNEPGPRIIYVNEAFTQMTGYSYEEIIGKTPRILQGPNSDIQQLKHLSECMRRFETCEVTTLNYKKNGEEFWVNFTVNAVMNAEGKTTHYIAIERDITNYKNAEMQKELLNQAITNALNERSIILESIGDAFFAVDNDWTVTYWNSIAEKVLHRSKREMLDQYLWDKFPDSVESVSYQKYHEAIETGKAIHFEDYYEPFKQWYEISAYPSLNGLSVYFRDITERKRMLLSLEQSQKNYSDLFHLSPLPNWVLDIDSLQFLDVNEAAIKLYGYTKEEFLTMTLKDIRHEEDVNKLELIVALQKVKQQKSKLGIVKHIKKTGEVILVDLQSSDIQYGNKNAKIIVAQDVTDRLKYIKAVEEQNEKLREISWMQSHLVRAPLARIMGLIPLFKGSQEDNQEASKILEYISTSAEELDQIIKNISGKI